MGELAKRWAVAGVAIPVVVVLLYMGGWPLAIAVAAIAGLGAWEYYRLAERGGVAPLAWLGTASASGLVLLAGWRPTFSGFAPAALGLLGTLGAIALVTVIVAGGPSRRPMTTVAVTVFGSLYTGLSLAFIPLLHALPQARGWTGSSTGVWGGLLLVALPLTATWVGDAVAFFAGTAWGRGGLAPSISPNKSWVGVWAGLAGAGAGATLWFFVARAFVPGLPVAGPFVAVGMGVFLGAGAIVGDLGESLLKREAGVKDSGGVFPGHGGVLDRLDALVFTLPAAYVALTILETVV